MGEMDIRRTSTDQLVAREYSGYQDTGLTSLLDKLAWGSPLILKGPKGAGKTLAIEQWAAQNEVPFLRKSCTAETTDRHLLGGYVMKSFEESFFVLGVLGMALDVANEMGGCVLVLEEINALNEEAQKAVNGLADYRREVDLHSRICKVYRLKGGAKVWIIGTMNPGYGGTYELNEDFLVKNDLPYIWSSGRLCNFKGCDHEDLQPPTVNGWFWSGSGVKMAPTNSTPPGWSYQPWSYTSHKTQFEARNVSQPDNAEFDINGSVEACMGLLNDIYSDGVKWHDIACYHTKPFICEDSDQLLEYVQTVSPDLEL